MKGIMKRKSFLITRDISFRSSTAHNAHAAWRWRQQNPLKRRYTYTWKAICPIC